MNKAEQLIACLEGEIAKRDARISELEAELCERTEEVEHALADLNNALAELAAIKAPDTVGEVVGWYRLDRPYEMTSYPSVCATWHKLGAPVAPLYAAPAAPAADAGLVEALEEWLADYDSCAANPDFEPFKHVAERVARTRAALAANRAKGVE